MTTITVLVWVGHIDHERDYNSIVVALDWSMPDALDRDDQQAFQHAFDCRVSEPPGVGFWVWSGDFDGYNNQPGIPAADVRYRIVRQDWRPARAVEVWTAQRNAQAREVST